jgi:LuxR family maltose regulon positive regulatory protein
MLVSGVSAYLQARAGRADEALVDIERAEAVLSGVAPVAPWAAVIVESFIARSWLLLEDRSASLATAARARAVLEQLPASPFLQELLDSAERAITSSDELAELTRAELRVWPLLVGRFTMREIAAQLHVSPETIKSQVASIYRKLGVSTRRELQERADAFGGLPDV